MTDDNDKLREFIEPGETLRWNGAAQPYGLFDDAHKKSTLNAVIWGLAVAIVLIGGYLWLCVSREVEVKNAIILFALGMALLIVWGPISTKKHLARMRYALTDKRVISLNTETGKAIAAPLPEVEAARIVEAGPGTCHVLLGAPILESSPKKLPTLAMHGKDAEGDDKVKIAKGVVFYNISAGDGKTLRALLNPMAVVEGAAA